MPRLLSLFDGTGSITKFCREAGWEIQSLDVDGRFGAGHFALALLPGARAGRNSFRNPLRAIFHSPDPRGAQELRTGGPISEQAVGGHQILFR